MANRGDEYDKPLTAAAEHARAWLRSVNERPVGPRVTADEITAAVGDPLPSSETDPTEVIDLLAKTAEPGLMAMGSGRFYGWVIGGTLPAALAADWLVSAWDQNAGMRYATPGVVALEETAGRWILELLDLPRESDVGFVTGATMSNFSCLAAARCRALRDAGWDVDTDGLTGAPRVRVLVGAQRHDTVDLALRYLGLGRPTIVDADEQGRVRVEALRAALDEIPDDAPTIVVLQAGNLHSGAFDPFEPAVSLARKRNAWVHVDGAFGLWAAASPSLQSLVGGLSGADSWTTDAHKTLNVPYDCGIAIVRDSAAVRAAMGVHTSYLVADVGGPGDPHEKVPELSRRARGVPVWAALRSLGRAGVVGLVDGLVRAARGIADGVTEIDGVEVLNDVVYTQVCLAFGSDERTREVTRRLIADGTAWMSGSKWRGRDVLRVSVSNWTTDGEDVRRSVDAVRRAMTAG
ncbi:MAG TPA: pyridoxal-dependent decarboxylase [Acidothermaceae bacterium]